MSNRKQILLWQSFLAVDFGGCIMRKFNCAFGRGESWTRGESGGTCSFMGGWLLLFPRLGKRIVLSVARCWWGWVLFKVV